MDPERRQHAANVIDAEMQRRGWKKARVAAEARVGDKSVERVLKASPNVSAEMIVTVAEALDVPLESVLPPRPPLEQDQLDRIENLLRALLIRAGASPSEIAEAAAARIEAPPDAGPPAP